jgi:hypothetical protein
MAVSGALSATAEKDVGRTRTLGLWLVVVAVAAGGALRAAGAILNRGIYWPDEIYQTLEPAHWLVFGYGLHPWEYIQGARGWVLPGAIAGIYKASQLAGLGQADAYLAIVRTVFALVGVLTVVATYRLARRLGASTLAAAVGTSACALWAPMVYFAPRAMAETASALPVVVGLSLALPEDAGRRSRILGTALLGVAVLLRLHSALFCVALLAVWLARGNLKATIDVALVLLASALVLGFVDFITWGGWFQSAIVYLRFSLSGGSEFWGREPLGYYLLTLLGLPGLVAVLLLPLALLGGLRSQALLAVTLVFLVGHSLVPHKELRFIVPAIPLLCALAALGLEQLRRTMSQPIFVATGALLLATSVWSAVLLPQLTFGNLGAYLTSQPQASAWDDSAPVNSLILAAGDQADLCGLRIYGPSLPWTGGYSYLNRRVPMYAVDRPPPGPGHYNYAIVKGPTTSAGVVRASGRWALVKTALRSCTPDPGYDWRLP